MQTVDKELATNSTSREYGEKRSARLDELQPPPSECRIVIVGAGLAGLATAQRLYEQFQDVAEDQRRQRGPEIILLEAQHRVGGRVHTVRPERGAHDDALGSQNHHESTTFFELGAQWLHGADQNPLHDWLNCELKLLDDFESAKMAFQGAFCTQFGQLVDSQLVERVLSIVCNCKSALTSQLEAANCNEKQQRRQFTNASQLFKCQLDELTKSDELLAANSELVDAIYDWFLRYETIENSCDSMDDVSTQSYTDWDDLGEGTLLNFKRGYSELLDWFCAQLPVGKCLYLQRQVVNIELLPRTNGDNNKSGRPILVRYENLAERRSLGAIECDHVVVTCSLGFLKKNHATLFKPELPMIKQQLIESIGFGTVNKIVMQFERPFWRQGEGIKLVWLEQKHGPNSNSNSNGEAEEQEDGAARLPPWTRDIIAFDSVRKQPNLLIGWIGGLGAKQMELESDERVGQICLRLLGQFLPKDSGQHQRPSRLLSCVCSRWTQNQFVCGSYSFHSMKSFGIQVDKLHEPILDADKTTTSRRKFPRILFAGEATAGELYSTTHGAIMSGWREADRLVEVYSLDGSRVRGANSLRLSSSFQVNSSSNSNGSANPTFGSRVNSSGMQAC